MSYEYRFHPDIDLHGKKSIDADVAARQRRTAEALLDRFKTFPGQILADEVGMGKTFVALAVAASVALGDGSHRPVVVMVPPGLLRKWERDFATFKQCCLPKEWHSAFRGSGAEDAVSFLKLLDDPPGRRPSVIMLTHGAMQPGRRLSDPWVKLSSVHPESITT